MKIIFDYNRTLFNPETDSLYPGVVELLQKASKKCSLYLISRNEPGRRDRLEELSIKNYFKDTVFVGEKTILIFKSLVGNEKNVIVVGDRVKDEICLGNQLGLTTIWIQQGKFSTETPTKKLEQPSYIVKNIIEVEEIISKYEK